jgi:hypothetical protein
MSHNGNPMTQKHYARYSPDHLRGAVSAIEGIATGSK